VPTMFSREQELRHCLDALASLDYPDYEVLLVNNRRDDDVATAWVQEYPRVRLLREHKPGNAAARNCGLQAATGEIVAFTDDDVVVDPAWLMAFARRFARHPDEVAVGGLMLPKELETEAQVMFEEYYPSAPRIMQPVSHRLARPRGRNIFRKATVLAVDDAGETLARFSLYAPSMGPGQSRAFRTEVLRSVGGFDRRIGIVCGEDILLWARLGWRGYGIGFEPSATVFHVHRRDDESLRRQIRNYGVGFTATLFAMTLEDPRHLAAMLATAPHALAVLTRRFWSLLRTRQGAAGEVAPSSYVAELARLELRGMLVGPLVYLRSAARARQWRS